jgi:hypothetical protein
VEQAVVEHAGLLHFAGCSMHDADDDMAAQTKGALARLQDRLEECEPLSCALMHCIDDEPRASLLSVPPQVGVGWMTFFR